jgi:hypothetical protein
MQQLIYLHTTTDDKSQEQLQNSKVMHVSLCLCTRVRTSTVVPEESLENVAATEFKRRSRIFLNAVVLGTTLGPTTRVRRVRAEKKTKSVTTVNARNCMAAATTHNKQQRQQGSNCSSSRAAASARGSMRGRRDGPTRTKLRPVQRTRQQPQSARDGGDSKRTTQVLTEVLRIGKSLRMSPHMSSPSPLQSFGTSL